VEEQSESVEQIRKRVVVVFVVGLLVGLCGFAAVALKVDGRPRTSTPPVVAVLQHPAGFSVRVRSKAWTYQQTADGYEFDRIGTVNSRSSSRISMIATTLTITPIRGLAQVKNITSGLTHFELTTGDSGSGGTETTLNARIICAQMVISVSQTLQVEEPQKPNFADAWALLDSVVCQPAPRTLNASPLTDPIGQTSTSAVAANNSTLVNVEIFGLRCFDNKPCPVSMSVNQHGLVISSDGLVATQREFGTDWVTKLITELQNIHTSTDQDCTKGEPRYVYRSSMLNHGKPSRPVCEHNIANTKAYIRLEEARLSLRAD
jgi:hypothetical protein